MRSDRSFEIRNINFAEWFETRNIYHINVSRLELLVCLRDPKFLSRRSFKISNFCQQGGPHFTLSPISVFAASNRLANPFIGRHSLAWFLLQGIPVCGRRKKNWDRTFST